MQVPLWLYLVTTFGVALIGVGGVVLSTRNASRQTDKQLARDRERSEEDRAHDRERAEEDRAHEREQWARDRRVDVFTRCASFVDDQITQGWRGGQPAEVLRWRHFVSEVGLWSNGEAHKALGMLSGSVFRLYAHDSSTDSQADLDKIHTEVNERALEFRAALREELDLPPFTEWS